MTDGHNVDQGIDELVAQASAVMGRPVSQDAYLLARTSGTEHGSAEEREKTVIQWVCLNDARAHGWSIFKVLTVTNPDIAGPVAGFLGSQKGRRFGTSFDPYEDDLDIAERLIAGQVADISGGATHFVHKTPAFVASGGWARTLANWTKLAPVYLGNVSSLVIFVPTAQAAALQATAESDATS
jgi:hypothetical protein